MRRIRAVLSRVTAWVRSPRSESDVAADGRVANSRAHGGPRSPSKAFSDAHTTTGTAANELFVGRAAGDDLGYTYETGAEARAAGESTKRERDRTEWSYGASRGPARGEPALDQRDVG